MNCREWEFCQEFWDYARGEHLETFDKSFCVDYVQEWYRVTQHNIKQFAGVSRGVGFRKKLLSPMFRYYLRQKALVKGHELRFVLELPKGSKPYVQVYARAIAE